MKYEYAYNPMTGEYLVLEFEYSEDTWTVRSEHDDKETAILIAEALNIRANKIEENR